MIQPLQQRNLIHDVSFPTELRELSLLQNAEHTILLPADFEHCPGGRTEQLLQDMKVAQEKLLPRQTWTLLLT
jgi:hypothetical protein